MIVCLIKNDVCNCRLNFLFRDDEFLADYLNEAGPGIYDCVGSYQLEGIGSNLFEHIEGDYFTVLGLPLLALLAFMRKISLIN